MLEMVRQTKVCKLLTVSAENKYFKLKLAVKNKKVKNRIFHCLLGELGIRCVANQYCEKKTMTP